MAARGVLLVFGVAVMALSSPSAPQGATGAHVAWQQQNIDEIEADLAGLEAAARWEGDPCGRIHRGARKLVDRLIDEEYLKSELPLEMIESWRARADRLLKICPNETGLIGDPHILEPAQSGGQYRPTLGAVSPAITGIPAPPAGSPISKPPPENAGPDELATWWTSEIAAINAEFRRIEQLTDFVKISSARAQLRERVLRLNRLYRSRQGKQFPPALLQSWLERLDRLIDRMRQLYEAERRQQFPAVTGSEGTNRIVPALDLGKILGGNSRQQQQAPGSAGNPIVDGINILGGENRQSEPGPDAQNRHEQQTAPESAKRQRSKAPQRKRQPGRCDKAQDQGTSDCPNK